MKQILWAAIDRIIQQMDEGALDQLLESFDNLPDLVFTSLNEASPANSKPQDVLVVGGIQKMTLML